MPPIAVAVAGARAGANETTVRIRKFGTFFGFGPSDSFQKPNFSKLCTSSDGTIVFSFLFLFFFVVNKYFIFALFFTNLFLFSFCLCFIHVFLLFLQKTPDNVQQMKEKSKKLKRRFVNNSTSVGNARKRSVSARIFERKTSEQQMRREIC